MGAKGAKPTQGPGPTTTTKPESQKTSSAQVTAKAEQSAKPEEQRKPTENDDEGEVTGSAEDQGPDFKDDGKSDPNATGDESYSFWDRNKTFKPEKKIKGSNAQKLHKTIKATMRATLGGGDLRKTVQLPEGEDLNEWIAVNTVHFYNAANMIYGTCAEFCTEQTCKNMSAGRNEYLWKDGVNYKKPTRVSAPVYIDLLLNWVNDQISNPELFPVDENAKFPRNFTTRVKDIYKRLFRLYAHLYYSHFEKISSIGAKAHLNTCFKHFVFFILEFKLVDEKGLAPLKNFIDKFKDQKET